MAKALLNKRKKKQLKQKLITKYERQKRTKKELKPKKRAIKESKGPIKKRREDTYFSGGVRL